MSYRKKVTHDCEGCVACGEHGCIFDSDTETLAPSKQGGVQVGHDLDPARSIEDEIGLFLHGDAYLREKKDRERKFARDLQRAETNKILKRMYPEKYHVNSKATVGNWNSVTGEWET